MTAKINLEEFRNKINEFRKENQFKIDNSTTQDDERYYVARGFGFERAVTIFLMCAEYAADEVDDETV